MVAQLAENRKMQEEPKPRPQRSRPRGKVDACLVMIFSPCKMTRHYLARSYKISASSRLGLPAPSTQIQTSTVKQQRDATSNDPIA